MRPANTGEDIFSCIQWFGPMSAVGGKPDARRKVRKSLLIARRRHSPASKFRPLKGRNRPNSAVRGRWRGWRLSDRKAAVQSPRSVRQLIAISGRCDSSGGSRPLHQNRTLARTRGTALAKLVMRNRAQLQRPVVKFIRLRENRLTPDRTPAAAFNTKQGRLGIRHFIVVVTLVAGPSISGCIHVPPGYRRRDQ